MRDCALAHAQQQQKHLGVEAGRAHFEVTGYRRTHVQLHAHPKRVFQRCSSRPHKLVHASVMFLHGSADVPNLLQRLQQVMQQYGIVASHEDGGMSTAFALQHLAIDWE